MANMDPEASYAQLSKLFGSKNPLLIVSNPSTPIQPLHLQPFTTFSFSPSS